MWDVLCGIRHRLGSANFRTPTIHCLLSPACYQNLSKEVPDAIWVTGGKNLKLYDKPHFSQ